MDECVLSIEPLLILDGEEIPIDSYDLNGLIEFTTKGDTNPQSLDTEGND